MSRSTTRRLAVVALAAVLLVGVAACSDDGDDGGAASGAVPAEVVTTLTPAEGMALLDERDDVVLIDVRTPEEYAEGHLEGSVNIDLNGPDFLGEIDDLDRDGTYVVYCRTGNRSAQAAAIMAEEGFTDVRDLGGIEAWTAAGGEVTTS